MATTQQSISSTTPTDLGAAPVIVQCLGPGAVSLMIADSAPSAGTLGFLLQPGPPIIIPPADSSSHVYAAMLGGVAATIASNFVSDAGPHTLSLSSAKSDAGVGLTATPGSGAFGITRTAGTSFVLTGEATSSNAKTDKAIWEFDLPGSYAAGSNIAVTVNCQASGGTITAATTTLTVAAYTEVNGVEAALTVSAAQEIPATATGLVFTITGTALVPGQHLALEAVMLVTTSAGAGTGVINSVSYFA
jgi:hypothetical protein